MEGVKNRETKSLAYDVFSSTDYCWLKRLCDLSGVRLLYVHRFVQGQQIPEAEKLRVTRAIQQLVQR